MFLLLKIGKCVLQEHIRS